MSCVAPPPLLHARTQTGDQFARTNTFRKRAYVGGTDRMRSRMSIPRKDPSRATHPPTPTPDWAEAAGHGHSPCHPPHIHTHTIIHTHTHAHKQWGNYVTSPAAAVAQSPKNALYTCSSLNSSVCSNPIELLEGTMAN